MLSCIDDYRQYLDQAFTPKQDISYETQLDLLDNLSQKQQICSLIKSILEDSRMLERVASLSYEHYNGFDKIVLLSSPLQYKLRLHIWWPASRGQLVENIHNHRWNFASAILVGAYRSQEFRHTGSGVDLYAYRYFSSEGRSFYSMEYLGEDKLECVFDGLMTMGSHYILEHSVLHRVISDGRQLTATLMLQGPPAKNFTNVFAYKPIPGHKQLDSSPMSVAQLSQKLQECLSILGK